MIKNTVRKFSGRHLSVASYPIVINSYGRSGSTVLTNSIIESSIKNRILFRKLTSRSISHDIWNLEKPMLQEGIIYKTHSYPPTQIENTSVRMIYTFADPVDVIFSLLKRREEKGEHWMKNHYNHLGVKYDNFDIINNDQLKLEKHLDSWLDETRIPIAFVKYENMWEYQKEISKFLGFRIQLPPHKKRKVSKEKSDNNIRRQIKITYSSLINKVNNLDNFKTNVT